MDGQDADVVIIGSGIQGLCCAYSLLRAGVTSIVIVEAADQAGGRSTRFSAAMLTTLTNHEATTRLAQTSINMYREMRTELLDATGLDVDFRWCGFAIVCRSRKAKANLRGEIDERIALGLRTEVDGGAAINELTNGLFRFDDDSLACLAPDDGYVNVEQLTAALGVYVRRKGARLGLGHRAASLVSDEGGIAGVRLATGAVIATRNVVNAAGVWAGEVASWIGHTVPITASRKTLVSVDLGGALYSHPIIESGDDGFYFRPSSAGMIVGVGFGVDDPLPDGNAPDPRPEDDAVPRTKEYLARWTTLRADVIEAIRPDAATAGYRPIHSTQTVVEGRLPTHLPLFGDPWVMPGYFQSCGWGEFGVTLGPVGGSEVARTITLAGRFT